jgi:hypothetical protein
MRDPRLGRDLTVLGADLSRDLGLHQLPSHDQHRLAHEILKTFGRVGYVAASETEVALIKTKSGAIKIYVTDQVLARVPREELDGAELQDGKLVSVLRLRYTNGVLWEFDIPRTAKKSAREFVVGLGARCGSAWRGRALLSTGLRASPRSRARVVSRLTRADGRFLGRRS